jgi:hypothetical protein
LYGSEHEISDTLVALAEHRTGNSIATTRNSGVFQRCDELEQPAVIEVGNVHIVGWIQRHAGIAQCAVDFEERLVVI